MRRLTGNPIGAGGACGYSMRRRPHPRERERAPCVHVPSRRPRTTHRGDSLHAATTARSSAPTAAARRRSCATWLLLVAVRSAAHDRPQLRRLWAERLDVPGLTHWNMWRRLERQGGSAGRRLQAGMRSAPGRRIDGRRACVLIAPLRLMEAVRVLTRWWRRGRLRRHAGKRRVRRGRVARSVPRRDSGSGRRRGRRVAV